MEVYISHNGVISRASDVHLSPYNRSFRYGDGCFETMKLVSGELPLKDLHFNRLFSALSVLKFSVPPYFTRSFVEAQIHKLTEANNHLQRARVRFTVFRSGGGMYHISDNQPHYIIESSTLQNEMNSFNEKGLTIGIFREAKKSCDLLSSLKSNSYLAYAMAAIWAKENQLDDGIVLNCSGRIADATIANVFIVVDGVIKTPLLSEGCVSGVMRRHLLSCFAKEKIAFSEAKIAEEDVMNAKEVFLTNAVYGIRWVKHIGDRSYDCLVSSALYRQFAATLNS